MERVLLAAGVAAGVAIVVILKRRKPSSGQADKFKAYADPNDRRQVVAKIAATEWATAELKTAILEPMGYVKKPMKLGLRLSTDLKSLHYKNLDYSMTDGFHFERVFQLVDDESRPGRVYENDFSPEPPLHLVVTVDEKGSLEKGTVVLLANEYAMQGIPVYGTWAGAKE